jgi:Fe-S cluster assembly protein SufD
VDSITKGRALNTFTVDAAAALGGPQWLAERRLGAAEALAGLSVPTAESDVWRYSPIEELDLDTYAPTPATHNGARSRAGDEARALARILGGVGALAIVEGGRLLDVERAGLDDSITFGGAAESGSPGAFGQVVSSSEIFVSMNDAFAPDVIVVDVPARTHVDAPILVFHWCDPGAGEGGAASGAVFPRTIVSVGEGSTVSVIEVLIGGAAAGRGLVVPVTELSVGDGALLSYVGVQQLGPQSWHIGRIGATVGRDATLRSFTVGLGADYDRSRSDAVITGQGGSTELRSAYFGSGTQVHDVRTMQDHAAPRSTSDLLCKGAVAQHSRSVYSGLIRVRRGAVRADAMQTNHNLVLDQSAHADSVPNLDIEENDVRCSHASTVGPVDEDQRYYVESRGVPPSRAERLIVLGFFDDIIERVPVAATAPYLRSAFGERLAESWHEEPAGPGEQGPDEQGPGEQGGDRD